MQITEVRITLREDEKLKAFASVTLDDMIVIRGLKIIAGATGVFVAMPARQRKDGSYQDVAHPINKDTRAWLEGKVIGAYKEEIQRVQDGHQPSHSVDYDGGGLTQEDAY